jgi:hypothetical protein
MADDTKTVEQLRHAALERMSGGWGDAAGKADEAALDTLIAAVRAETLAAIRADCEQQIERLKQLAPRPPLMLGQDWVTKVTSEDDPS